jgi:hypothetical protein
MGIFRRALKKVIKLLEPFHFAPCRLEAAV